MKSGHSGSMNCVLQPNNPRGLRGCCKAASLTWWRLKALGVRTSMPLAALPYSPDPWNALPLTRVTEETSVIVTLNTFADTDISCSFESEAVPGTIPRGQNSPRCVRFGLYAEQMTASAFVAPRHLNKNAWLYRSRPAVAHQGFVRLSQHETHHS